MLKALNKMGWMLCVLLLSACNPSLEGEYRLVQEAESMSLRFEADEKVTLMTTVGGGFQVQGSYLQDGKKVLITLPGGTSTFIKMPNGGQDGMLDTAMLGMKERNLFRVFVGEYLKKSETQDVVGSRGGQS